MIDAIEKAREKHFFALWAYVVMPEHVHILLWPTIPTYSISQILTTIKQSVSKRSLLFVRRYSPGFLKQMADRHPNGTLHYRFWQRGGGYDRNLTEPTTIWSEIDYMHNNPIRRGLCARATDWIWSSAIEYESPGKGLLRLDHGSLPRTIYG
jgi:REP-associated tyrosine transposase